MGWLRNRRRNKLKDALVKEGKLNQFRTKFQSQIKKIDDQMRGYDAEAKAAHAKGADYETRLKIYQVNEANHLRNEILRLLAILEKASMQKDSQESYQEFISQLNQFNVAFNEDKNKKRKERKVLRRYRSETHQLESQIDWIDKRVERIDRSIDRKENISDKSLANIDVEGYFKSNE